MTSGPEYQLRIESYRGFGIDWLLPLLATAASRIDAGGARPVAGLALAGSWLALWRSNKSDLLAQFDPGHAEGHTHHISAATRLIGDVGIALGPKPARKWLGAGAFANALALLAARHDRKDSEAAAAMIAAAFNALALVSFRRSERDLETTLRTAAPSLAVGAAAGALALLLDSDH